jgi:N6-L-threonylcarbamoyladenine synthase
VESCFADLDYCSDNAAMIGRAAVDAYVMEDFIESDDLDVYSRVSLEKK